MYRFTALDLRKNPTDAEVRMWQLVRGRQIYGYRFRRQHQIGPFIVDFVCLRKRLIVELDGPIHEKRIGYDQNRDRWLNENGYIVLRFKNEEFDNEPEKVLERIRTRLAELPIYKRNAN